MYKETSLDIQQWLLPGTNKNCRPGMIRSSNGGVVIHWVANPGTTPMQNAKYFSTLSGDKYASAHYIIAIDGSILRTLPEREVAYHVGARQYMPGITDKLSTYPNYATVGIELCHPDWSGEPSQATYNSCVALTADILKRWKRDENFIYRHNDITGKICPKWFVEHEDKWKLFKEDVKRLLIL